MQEMYLESVTESTSVHNTKTATVNAKLDALCSHEVLAVSQPPAAYPVPKEHAPPKDLSAAIAEIAQLRSKLVDCQQRRDSAQNERDALRKQAEGAKVCCTPRRIFVSHATYHGMSVESTSGRLSALSP